MKIKYQNWNPRDNSIVLVNTANDIIEEYETDGYILTLRQLYYQFVARALIENTERSYKNLGSIITKARMAGLISWEAIEDRTREHHAFWYDEDELNAINELSRYIRFDRWDRQDTYVEVWVEKEALGNVIERACSPLLVNYMACKGYLSASEAWRAGMRYQRKLNDGKQCILIHLGDHDPSGIDMTRDNRDRLDIFTEEMSGVDVRRIALNMDQIDKYSPPPNPTKIKDSRSKDYIKKFGRTSWELDALEPQVIEKLITKEIKQFIDWDSWEEIGELQRKKRNLLDQIGEKWDWIKQQLDDE